MAYKNSVLAVITARGNSKTVLRKNLRPLAGKPLLAWTVETAKKSKYIDRLILSTEDEEIAMVGKELGCEVPFMRPVELSKDDVSATAPVIHAITQLPTYTHVVLLQPTSPLRTTDDIDNCIIKCLHRQANVAVSVSKPETSPYLMGRLDDNDHIVPLLSREKINSQRQDLPEVYCLNGAVYVAQCEWLLKTGVFTTPETVAYVMPPERSIDVNTEFDFQLIETLLVGKQ